jgi:hypothetical protein
MDDAARTGSRPVSILVLIGGLVFQGLSGIAGGLGLVADPTGVTLRIPQELLVDSPFSDYLIPGLILLGVLGVLPLLVAWSVWSAARWSWRAAFGIGVALVVWIGVQIAIIGYQSSPPLQAVYGTLGLAISALALTPSVRGYGAARAP